jgi:hypothetical protein
MSSREPSTTAGSALERTCINCEWADPVGDREIVKTVDCHNSLSPRFTPERDFWCREWLLSYSIVTGEVRALSSAKPALGDKSRDDSNAH